MIKKTIMVLLMTIVLSGLTGCGSKSTSEVNSSTTVGSADMANSQNNSGFSNSVSDKSTQAVPTSSTGVAETTQQKPVDGHKIIQTGNISMESLKFDESVSKTLEYVTSIGGYAESQNSRRKGITTSSKGN